MFACARGGGDGVREAPTRRSLPPESDQLALVTCAREAPAGSAAGRPLDHTSVPAPPFAGATPSAADSATRERTEELQEAAGSTCVLAPGHAARADPPKGSRLATAERASLSGTSPASAGEASSFGRSPSREPGA